MWDILKNLLDLVWYPQILCNIKILVTLWYAMFVYIVIFIEDSYIMSLIFGIVKFSFCISTEKVLFKLKYEYIFYVYNLW